jgi:DNA-binding NarL/FixJ family response regulator
VKSPQRVLIVDDHPILLRGLRATLEGEQWVGEVVEAMTVAAAVKEAVASKPDLVVMDVRLPDGNGIEATRRILRVRPEATVLILTMDGDHDLVAQALEAGAHGFLLKDLDASDLAASLRAVAGGSVVLGPNVEPALTSSQGGGARRPPPLDRLTDRELEVLSLLAASATTARIARDLGVTEKTVRNQLTAIFGKLGVADRVQAALLAQRLGLMR